jgi:hypothetical protein
LGELIWVLGHQGQFELLGKRILGLADVRSANYTSGPTWDHQTYATY